MIKDQGWLNIYKPSGISSFGVVKKIKKKFNLSKIGHGGTLDPLAEGVLPIAIGSATKLIQFINQNIKEYEFEIKWGEQTTTDDQEGKIIETSSNIPNIDQIKDILTNFKGEILQKPPKASAIKINGKRAYNLLRQNKDFEMNYKKVFVEKAKILNFKRNSLTKMFIRCGKGFFIRSFARDIAEKLNTKAHIYSLKRTKVGKFEEKNAILLDDLLKIRQTLFEFNDFLDSTSMLDDILAYEIEDEKSKISIMQGKAVNISLNHSLNFSEEKTIFLTDKGRIVSYGRLSSNLFKPQKVLI